MGWCAKSSRKKDATVTDCTPCVSRHWRRFLFQEPVAIHDVIMEHLEQCVVLALSSARASEHQTKSHVVSVVLAGDTT